jgi:hypothetical protein
LLFLALLFAYISHLKDNLQNEVNEMVCWIKAETIQFNERLKKEELIRFEEEVTSRGHKAPSEDSHSQI